MPAMVNLQKLINQLKTEEQAQIENPQLQVNRNAFFSNRIVDIPEPSLEISDEEILVDMEAKYHGHLTFIASGSMHVEEFAINHAESGEELFSNVEKKK